MCTYVCAVRKSKNATQLHLRVKVIPSVVQVSCSAVIISQVFLYPCTRDWHHWLVGAGNHSMYSLSSVKIMCNQRQKDACNASFSIRVSQRVRTRWRILLFQSPKTNFPIGYRELKFLRVLRNSSSTDRIHSRINTYPSLLPAVVKVSRERNPREWESTVRAPSVSSAIFRRRMEHQMAVFTVDLYARVGVVSIFTYPLKSSWRTRMHTRGITSAAKRAHSDTPGGLPRRRERACQLRGNEVHDWITRGCIAIELRLLVRHGVGGRGWKAAFADGIHRYPPAPVRSLSLSVCLPLLSLFLSVSFSFPSSRFLPPSPSSPSPPTSSPSLWPSLLYFPFRRSIRHGTTAPRAWARARCRTKTSSQLTNNPKQFGRSDAICAFLSEAAGPREHLETVRLYSHVRGRDRYDCTREICKCISARPGTRKY